MKDKREYCNCTECFSIFTDSDEWGEWEVCTKCGKIIEVFIWKILIGMQYLL